MKSGVACVNGLSKRTWDAFHQSRGDSLGSHLLLLQECNLLTKSHLVTGLTVHLEDNQQCLCATQATSTDHSNFIKHTLHAFVSILAEYGVAGSWSDLNAADVRTWAKEASDRAAEWLDTPKETLKEFRIPEAAASLFTTPLRLRTKKFIRKRQAKVESLGSERTSTFAHYWRSVFWWFGHTTMEQARARRITWTTHNYLQAHPRLGSSMRDLGWIAGFRVTWDCFVTWK